MDKKINFGGNIVLTDWGAPDYLDGARMQFMVTEEIGFGRCLGYFSKKEDAELFARAKASATLTDTEQTSNSQ